MGVNSVLGTMVGLALTLMFSHPAHAEKEGLSRSGEKNHRRLAVLLPPDHLKNTRLEPKWSHEIDSRGAAEGNPLIYKYWDTPEARPFSQNRFVDLKTQRHMKLQYERIMREYEQQHIHGLRYEQARRYNSQNRKFSRYMARTLAKKKFDQGLKEARKNSKEVATLSSGEQNGGPRSQRQGPAEYE